MSSISSSPRSQSIYNTKSSIKKKSKFNEARDRLANPQNSFDEIMENEYSKYTKCEIMC